MDARSATTPEDFRRAADDAANTKSTASTRSFATDITPELEAARTARLAAARRNAAARVEAQRASGASPTLSIGTESSTFNKASEAPKSRPARADFVYYQRLVYYVAVPIYFIKSKVKSLLPPPALPAQAQTQPIAAPRQPYAPPPTYVPPPESFLSPAPTSSASNFVRSTSMTPRLTPAEV